MREWGFDQATAQEFFGDFCKYVLLLDTEVEENLERKLSQFANYISQPYEILPIGLEYFQLFLDRIIKSWRSEKEKRIADSLSQENNRRISELAMTFEIISEVSKNQSEETVINSIIETFKMPFAPGIIECHPATAPSTTCQDQSGFKLYEKPYFEDKMPDEVQNVVWLKSGTGFLLRLRHMEEVIGVILVDDVKHPEYLKDYVNIALIISAVCGIATINSRGYEKINSNLREKEVLLKEIHHRVKNNLNVVSSLQFLHSTTTKNDEARKTLRESQTRIFTMSAVHETLYSSEDLANVELLIYIRKLVNSIVQTFTVNTAAIKISISGDEVKISAVQASPLGLTINEIITNSIKYAFPNHSNGEIKISISRRNDILHLTISNNGTGIPADMNWKTSDSLGLKLIRSLVENQLNGTILQGNEKGASYKIEFKIEEQSNE